MSVDEWAVRVWKEPQLPLVVSTSSAYGTVPPAIAARLRARHLARALLAAACAYTVPGVPLAARLELVAPEVLGPELR